MTKKFVIDIPMKPEHKQRPRFDGRSGNVYTPTATSVAEKTIALIVKNNLMTRGLQSPLFVGPVRFSVVFTFQRPPSVKTRVMHVVRPDAENCGKLVADSLNGVLWVDDSQIVELNYQKEYGSQFNIRIEAEELMTSEENGQKKSTLRKRLKE